MWTAQLLIVNMAITIVSVPSEVKGCRFRVIIWIRVDYEQYFMIRTLYMAVPIEEVNDGITLEQSTFSKIDESKTLEVSCRFCITTLGQ